VITTLVPWFGSNRTLAENVGRALQGYPWVGVPFAGGMCELRQLDARTILVGDLHAHVLNLAAVVADDGLNGMLRTRLAALPFHPDVLADAQARCRERERKADDDWFGGTSGRPPADLDWACDYFVSAWMSRNGNAGTKGEFAAPLSARWDAGGGDSATRFRNATDSLAEWQKVMRRCTFIRAHASMFLAGVIDRDGHALYCDPPWPEDGDGYKFRFDEREQRLLGETLARFERTRVLIRYGDHPLIRDIYSGPRWHWAELTGRTMTNAAKAEVLISNWAVEWPADVEK
jgi:DNA adenine methylase